MGYFATVISTLFAIFPSWFAIAFLGLLAIAVIVMIVKIVGFILDAIPFL